MEIWHGIIVDASFHDRSGIYQFSRFAQKQVGSWNVAGITVPKAALAETLKKIQLQMIKGKPFYNHLYFDRWLIIIFAEKIYNITTDKQTWGEPMIYGTSLGIPTEQLDFFPHSLLGEQSYFSPEDFLMSGPRDNGDPQNKP